MKQDVIHPNDPTGRYLFFEYISHNPDGPMSCLAFRSHDSAYIKDLTAKIRDESVQLSWNYDSVLVYDLDLNKVVYKSYEDDVIIDLLNGKNK